MDIVFNRAFDLQHREKMVATTGAIQQTFCDLLLDDFHRLVPDRVLDIGCGSGLPNSIAPIRRALGRWDGVDPDTAVFQHQNLERRFHGTLEECDIQPTTYGMAFAYNVLEHLANPQSFFDKLHSVMESDGIFWALTPNRFHPFTWLSRGLEVAGLKAWMGSVTKQRENKEIVNDYPAYYRANSPGAIRRFASKAGFRSASFYYFPACNWHVYFPQMLKFLPHTYNSLVGTRIRPLMLLLAMRLAK